MSTPSPECYIVMRDSSQEAVLGGCQFTDTIFFMLDNDEIPVLPREFALSQKLSESVQPDDDDLFHRPERWHCRTLDIQCGRPASRHTRQR
jgi:hypothetical protein